VRSAVYEHSLAATVSFIRLCETSWNRRTAGDSRTGLRL